MAKIISFHNSLPTKQVKYPPKPVSEESYDDCMETTEDNIIATYLDSYFGLLMIEQKLEMVKTILEMIKSGVKD